MASSSLLVPNSFSRVAFEALSIWPWAPCLMGNQLAFCYRVSHCLSSIFKKKKESSPWKRSWLNKRDPFTELRGKKQVDLLVGDEDLERADDLSERDALVGLPVLGRLRIVDEDDEVLVLALVVDHGLLCSASGHDYC